MNRPLTDDQIRERVDLLCELVAEGQTLRQIAAQMGLSVGTLLGHVSEQPYSNQYARAREAASDLFEADIITEAEAVTPENAAAARVKIDALKWVAGKRAPKKYGERIQQEHSGIIQIQDMTDDELDRRIAQLVSGGEG
ncbi:terminase small subunit-like protein [Azotobacter vinelandii]